MRSIPTFVLLALPLLDWYVVFGYGIRKGPETNQDISYTTHYITQKVDHFGFANDNTYKQRYLLNDQHWRPGSPIFFYTGNEGAIDWFCNNTGIMWEWAPSFNAMLIFAEHRYYGESLPYGNKSFDSPNHLNYLTSEQALADFVSLIADVKQRMPATSKSPVVAFGGSYGGMLAAWLRMKYPSAVVGAFAASAPIWEFGDLVPLGGFAVVTTKSYASANPNCPIIIRRSWSVMDQLASSVEGREFLASALGLCNPVKSSAEVKSWLSSTWINLAMANYPYKANFLEPLPAWPVKAICSHLSDINLDHKELVHAVRHAVDVYYNYTGSASCYKTSESATGNLGDQGWDIQSCTEMVMPMSNDGVNDMFEPSPWNMTAVTEDCQKKFKLTPRPDWIIRQYGGRNISAHSNIIFSNGLLDPWSAGGVMQSISESLVAIVIADGAHHVDLRSSHPDDPISVQMARKKEKAIIAHWLGYQPKSLKATVGRNVL
ncbi:hypothetical protein CAPTEDRAFT_174591 [Capitella teleta]|uniref:Lysosomal Pro-X carboxypeptidase n=1 Tax=Capitella teleta TaxID=283909 RepID=R7UMA3_CAPTE|nr:hypothetical protein CAPTEDRAFT_174591 [Capitella teleta]|eukprot:ELU04397.1 hypothetical protein CAPTEDRAFT_174591 [Capitella teleta]